MPVCVSEGQFVRATAETLQYYQAILQQTTGLLNARGDLAAMFRRAFNLLASAQNIDSSTTSMCESMIAYFTSGDVPANFRDAVVALNQEQTSFQARVFTYGFQSPANYELSRMACATQGAFFASQDLTTAPEQASA